MVKTFQQFLIERNSSSLNKKYDFSSVIYLLPENISKKIYDWGIKNIDDEDLFKDPKDPTFGREDEIHCTVIYGIHDKKPSSVKNIIETTKPFEIKLGKISAFTAPEKFDVVKIEVQSKDLHNLHKEFCDKLEVTKTFPEYKPHVTIAYLKKGKSNQYIGSQKFEDLSMEVSKVVFSSSLGIKTHMYLMK